MSPFPAAEATIAHAAGRVRVEFDLSQPSFWVDADACPRHVWRMVPDIANRFQVHAYFVVNGPMFLQQTAYVHAVKTQWWSRAEAEINETDDYIVRWIRCRHVLITKDSRLAARVYRKLPCGVVIDYAGKHFPNPHLVSDGEVDLRLVREAELTAPHAVGRRAYDRDAIQAFLRSVESLANALRENTLHEYVLQHLMEEEDE